MDELEYEDDFEEAPPEQESKEIELKKTPVAGIHNEPEKEPMGLLSDEEPTPAKPLIQVQPYQ